MIGGDVPHPLDLWPDFEEAIGEGRINTHTSKSVFFDSDTQLGTWWDASCQEVERQAKSAAKAGDNRPLSPFNNGHMWGHMMFLRVRSRSPAMRWRTLDIT